MNLLCWNCGFKIVGELVTWRARRLPDPKWYAMNLHPKCAAWLKGEPR